MYFGTDEQILGVIAVADEVRDSSAAVISELLSCQLNTLLCLLVIILKPLNLLVSN